ncbi:N-acetyl sugar amidotransferase [Anaerovorax odorimutans]|uniref:N-acetyl sugar amidotransferase n=1 Tax=Anaerovorax odorimutans TaxID=109327 RepID=UPI00040F4012|nr:N-acetyl sugar amidotransferase [Anaerovorax odorimutans]
MKYCKKCVMPDTRPGISFDENGVCSACNTQEKKKKINYDERFEELKKICDKYRGINGNGPDCAIAVSGGKDSHYQVYVMKELLNMNPILFSVEDNFTMTEAGKHNLKNISEEFGCDIISIKPNIKLQKKLMRKTFEKYGKPTWYIDRLIYTYPLQMAIKFNTPLLVYGENVSYEYGGSDAVETYSAREILSNGVASDIPLEELIDEDINEKDLHLTIAPSIEDINKLDPIYLSYFIEWNSYKNYIFAKSRGFHDLTHEWDRTMCAENFDQVDSYAYLVHAWMKYPKFGHACATDYASRFVRYGMMTREEAEKLVSEKDHALDPKAIKDFCDFTGYAETEFWKIIDKFYNKEIFEKNKYGEWKLK